MSVTPEADSDQRAMTASSGAHSHGDPTTWLVRTPDLGKMVEDCSRSLDELRRELRSVSRQQAQLSTRLWIELDDVESKLNWMRGRTAGGLSSSELDALISAGQELSSRCAWMSRRVDNSRRAHVATAEASLAGGLSSVLEKDQADALVQAVLGRITSAGPAKPSGVLEG